MFHTPKDIDPASFAPTYHGGDFNVVEKGFYDRDDPIWKADLVEDGENVVMVYTIESFHIIEEEDIDRVGGISIALVEKLIE